MQPKGIPRYLGNTFSILSRQTLLKISEIFDIVRSKNFKMANKMAVQEFLYEIVADQDFFYLKFFYFNMHIGVVKLRARGQI